MDGASRDYPPGDMRVSDAERDRAVSELGVAYQAGRLTAEEFDQRSSRALRARTGEELTALFADLPLDHAPVPRAGSLELRSARVVATRVAMGASAAAAVSLAALALANGLRTSSAAVGPNPAKIAIAREILGGTGRTIQIHFPAAPAPGFDWAGTITPAVVALLLIAAIVVLSSTLRSARVNRA
jgi:DUF1707 SHOCT-like domain